MKKILAIAVALVMVMALCVPAFAVEAADVADMDVAFEWTEGKAAHDWWTAKDVFSADDFAKFIEAINTEGAVIEIAGNNTTSGGTMTNFGTDFEKGYMTQMAGEGKWPMGEFDLYLSIAEAQAAGKAPETFDNAIFQFNVYDSTEDVTVSKVVIYVPAGAAAADDAADDAAEAPADDAAAEAPADDAAEAPADDAAEAPADDAAAETPAEAPAETPAPATGLALAVVPAVVAMAAAVIAKKH